MAKVCQVDQSLSLQMLVTAVVAGYLVIDPGLGVLSQILLPGWQGLPASPVAPSAPGTIIDPVEDEKCQQYQEEQGAVHSEFLVRLRDLE